jgi:hypothetical protein
VIDAYFAGVALACLAAVSGPSKRQMQDSEKMGQACTLQTGTYISHIAFAWAVQRANAFDLIAGSDSLAVRLSAGSGLATPTLKGFGRS